MKKTSGYILCAALLVAVDVLIIVAHIFLKNWLGFFDLDKEGGLKSVFSAFQLLMSGGMAGGIALLLSKLKASKPFITLWFLLMLLFFYLALDDLAMIHERIGFVLNHLTNWHGMYESFNWLIYFSPFILFGAVSLLLGIRSLAHWNKNTQWLSICGLVGFILTLLIEYIGGALLKNGIISLYHLSIIVEESTLLLGESFFLVALAVGFSTLFSKTFIAREQQVLQEPQTLRSVITLPTDQWMRFFSFWIVIGLVWIISIAVSITFFGFALPLLVHIEQLTGKGFPYEAILRFAFLWSHALLLAGSLLWVAARGKERHATAWMIMAISFLSLAVLFFGDTQNRLMEEYSWIRYTTAGFLIAAAFAAMHQALASLRRRLRMLACVWIFLGIGFLFGSLDELFQIHEWLGGIIETSFHLPHVATDLITVGYALVGLIAICAFFVLFNRYYRDQLFSLGIFLLGGMTYFISTMLDTLDVVATVFLKNTALRLASQPQFIFHDWYALLWSPHNFLNALEEVLEHTSAALFFISIFILIIAEKNTSILRFIRVPSVPITRIIVFGVFSIGIAIAAIGIHQGIRAGVAGTQSSQRIAGPQEGLLHADDAAYHPAWGLIIGNEGGNNVLQWKNGQVRPLPDPKRLISDTDSIAVTDAAVYASSGAKGSIFRYQETKGWEEIWTRNDGLAFPEALTATGDVLYVVDESRGSLFKLEKGKKPSEWRPAHADWKSPEGIAYDQKTKHLIVTDDTSGAIFEITFGVSIKKIAQVARAEDIAIAEDGTYIVSDNGGGSIVHITRDGKKKTLIQMNRAYHDVQGVAINGSHLYVVTSDGYGQGSFMPSFVFDFELRN